MRFKRLHAQHYRNIAFASVELDAPACFLLGPNGQGKTNALEALGLITALRSFRTHEASSLIAQAQAQARLRYELEHEHEESCDVTLHLSPHAKEAFLHGEKLPRLADLMGRFPTVALCAEDMQLLRGASTLRRRFLDMTLSIRADYLENLARYHRALKQRNAALKHPHGPTLSAFEHEMAPLAVALTHARTQALAELSKHLCETYAQIATTEEAPGLVYEPSHPLESAEDYLRLWHNERPSDERTGSTRKGPHRDDLTLMLKGSAAKDFASEGQQRALVLALRLAQAVYFYVQSGVRAVLLADDILGQLDPTRQERFWHALGPQTQVVATGTTPPLCDPPSGPWRIIRVEAGNFTQA